MLDIAILALRLLIVALLYAFLFIVIRTSLRGLAAPPAKVDRALLTLVVLDPGSSELASGVAFRVADGATLGRSHGADLVLSDTAVSAEHARLEHTGRGWIVSDLGSTNGTKVNETTIHGRARLAEGDVLTVGTVQLQVRALQL